MRAAEKELERGITQVWVFLQSLAVGREKGDSMKRPKLPRMTEWLVIALLLAAGIYIEAPQQLGVSLYKLSLLATAAWFGYWIDRSLFPYARPDDLAVAPGIEASACMIRRAIIVGCAMLAVSLGA
jgi:hypothetical protein